MPTRGDSLPLGLTPALVATIGGFTAGDTLEDGDPEAVRAAMRWFVIPFAISATLVAMGRRWGPGDPSPGDDDIP